MAFRSVIGEIVEEDLQAFTLPGEKESDIGTGAVFRFHQALLGASTWQDLSVVLEQVQAAFEADEMDQDTAEELAQVATQEAEKRPDDAKERRLADLFHEGQICRVYSRILGEEVLFVADGVEVPANNTLTVYRTSELQQLVGMKPEALCRIHASKVALEGEVIKNISSGLQIPIEKGLSMPPESTRAALHRLAGRGERVHSAPNGGR